MNQQCKSELEKAETMQEVFDIVKKYYDLPATKLNFTTRVMVVAGIKTAIRVTNAPEK
jgi:hypothetical protein